MFTSDIRDTHDLNKLASDSEVVKHSNITI